MSDSFHENKVVTLTVEGAPVTAIVIDLSGASPQLASGLAAMSNTKNKEAMRLEAISACVPITHNVLSSVYVLYAKDALAVLTAHFPDTQVVPVPPGAYMTQFIVPSYQSYVLGELDAELNGLLVTKSEALHQSGLRFKDILEPATHDAVVSALSAVLSASPSAIDSAVSSCERVAVAVGDVIQNVRGLSK